MRPERIRLLYAAPGNDLAPATGPSRKLLELGRRLAGEAGFEVVLAFRRAAPSDLEAARAGGLRVEEIDPGGPPPEADGAGTRGVDPRRHLRPVRALWRYGEEARALPRPRRPRGGPGLDRHRRPLRRPLRRAALRGRSRHLRTLEVGEALACGRPVATTPRGGPAERVRDGENGFLLPNEEAAWAALLARLPDRAGLAALGRRAEEDAPHPWEETARIVASACRDALAGGRSGGGAAAGE